MIKVLLVDDQSIIREGLASLLSTKEDIEIVGEAENGKVAVERSLDLQPEYVTQAMSYGAKGYLLKDTPSTELAQAIRSVNQGYTQLGPGLFEKMRLANPTPTVKSAPELATLTPREKEVLQLIAAGYSNREIAEQLYIAERTVKNHVNSILRRLNLRDRTQAAIFANSHF